MHKTDIRLRRRRRRGTGQRGFHPRVRTSPSPASTSAAAASAASSSAADWAVPEGRVAGLPLGTRELAALLPGRAEMSVSGAEMGVPSGVMRGGVATMGAAAGRTAHDKQYSALPAPIAMPTAARPVLLAKVGVEGRRRPSKAIEGRRRPSKAAEGGRSAKPSPTPPSQSVPSPARLIHRWMSKAPSWACSTCSVHCSAASR